VLLSQYLDPSSVLIAPEVKDRDELFGLLASVFLKSGLSLDCDEVVRRLIERETILSTGIGGGVAVPHAQISGLGCLAIAASVHPDGIDYPALDDKPVRLVFCLIGDTNTAADHLAGLARLARLARKGSKLEDLIKARTGEEFVTTLSRLEGV
jgi:mannitol/fructose-specific phosphotransferase system IIA component (Ntr-type)